MTASLSGCASLKRWWNGSPPPPAPQDKWIGRNADELVMKVGAPAREASLKSGGRVLTWRSNERSTSSYGSSYGYTSGETEHSACETSYTTDADNIIRGWSSRGDCYR